MKIIGITGGIAAGKSLVSDLLIKLGEYVICADQITHKLYNPNESGSDAIRRVYGEEYLLGDGSVDRKKLGNLVFNDSEKLKQLNELILPLIFEEIQNSIDESHKLVFLDAAILIESGLDQFVDEIWLVITKEDEKIKRLMKRNNINEIEAKKIIDLQMSDDEKANYTDIIIDNNGSISDTYIQVFKMLLKEKDVK